MNAKRENRQKLYRSFALLRSVRLHMGDVPLQVAEVFFAVAIEEGLSQRELMERLDISKASISRIISTLGEWTWRRTKGPGLLETYEDPYERRKKPVRLTSKGRKLADDILHSAELKKSAESVPTASRKKRGNIYETT